MHLPSSCAFCKELRNSAAASERDKAFVFWLRVSRMKKSEMRGLLVSYGISLLFSLLFLLFIITRDPERRKYCFLLHSITFSAQNQPAK